MNIRSIIVRPYLIHFSNSYIIFFLSKVANAGTDAFLCVAAFGCAMMNYYFFPTLVIIFFLFVSSSSFWFMRILASIFCAACVRIVILVGKIVFITCMCRRKLIGPKKFIRSVNQSIVELT